MKIKIRNSIEFNNNSKPLIIAEISGNHSGNKKKFLNLIKEAYNAGADLVKIQTYEPKDITINSNSKPFIIKKGIWKNKSLWKIYKSAQTPFAWHKDAFKLANKMNKILFSSPFSIRAVDLLEKMKVPIYKVSSFEITDLKLINYIARKKKPIIISTGMAEMSEIRTAIKEINKFHKKIIILHCVSDYPTTLKNTELYKIKELKKTFKDYLIGISDHTEGNTSSLIASTFGIVAIEKHFKLNSKEKTIDSKFSIDTKQLKKLKNNLNDIFYSLKKRKKRSKKMIYVRRSIFSKKNIKKGEKLSIENIETFRPKIGICASEFFKILGKKSKRNIKALRPIFKTDLY
tara:strand:- start:243 stop:1277 length:1035 start_codon:yes stop_codon:yes gene_type:complete